MQLLIHPFKSDAKETAERYLRNLNHYNLENSFLADWKDAQDAILALLHLSKASEDERITLHIMYKNILSHYGFHGDVYQTFKRDWMISELALGALKHPLKPQSHQHVRNFKAVLALRGFTVIESHLDKAWQSVLFLSHLLKDPFQAPKQNLYLHHMLVLHDLSYLELYTTFADYFRTHDEARIALRKPQVGDAFSWEAYVKLLRSLGLSKAFEIGLRARIQAQALTRKSLSVMLYGPPLIRAWNEFKEEEEGIVTGRPLVELPVDVLGLPVRGHVEGRRLIPFYSSQVHTVH